MPVYSYLDLSTSHVTEAEMDAINDRFADVDDISPRVIVYDYGAWVNVPSDADVDLVKRYPNIAACLARARELGCEWINFDRDASHDDVLPIYEW